MNFNRDFRSCSLFSCAAFVLATAVARMTVADAVSLRPANAPPGTAPTLYADVKVTDIRLGHIFFTTNTGNPVSKDLRTVVSMTIDDEPEFNQAQQDYSAGKFAPAVDEFDSTIQKTDKSWLKTYCEPLMTDAANKAGRFDKAVEGYVFLVTNEPERAPSYRPTLPQNDSASLDAAAKSLSDATANLSLSTAQEAALLSLLLEVDRARKDTAAIDEVASRLKKIAPDAGDGTANEASIALADAKIAEAAAADHNGDYDKAVSIINANGNLFVEPGRQAEAMFILARAREGQAEAKNDTGAWQDAVIAYMRVVADFKAAPGAPRVATALVRAANILKDHLDQPGKALRIFQSVAADYPSSPAAADANQEIEKLQAAGVRPE